MIIINIRIAYSEEIIIEDIWITINMINMIIHIIIMIITMNKYNIKILSH
jgi:hypothetical protein